MNAARRSIKRRDWPPNLYETRPGYYLWRDPRTRQGIALGYIPLAALLPKKIRSPVLLLAYCWPIFFWGGVWLLRL